MSSKRPRRGSRGGAQTPKTQRPAPDTGEKTVKATVSGFAVGTEETSSGGSAPNLGDDAPARKPGKSTPPPPRAPFDLSDLVIDELQNIGTFPTLGAALSTGGGAAATPLQRTVEQALQAVLGRLPRSGDHRSFVAALNMSFTYKEAPSGGGRYEWTPRTYIGKTDLGGGVTGAQASLVTFARSAYDNSITLLDDLESLVTDADEEEVEASKTIVRSLWTEFVNELGKEGGPRAARADSLSSALLGTEDSAIEPFTDPASCQLTRLGVLLGMVETEDGEPIIDGGRPRISRDFVVTTAEETNLTNFVSMSDYMYSAQAAWNNYVLNFFQKDLGTGLVLMARLLSVLAETVDEVYSAMDSVYVGPAERLTIRVGIESKSLSVEELLSWVHTFATEEAPRLIQDSGRLGVEAIIPTAELLRDLMDAFLRRVQAGARERAGRRSGESGTSRREEANALPVGLLQLRVLNPIKDVFRYLDALVKQARQISGLPEEEDY